MKAVFWMLLALCIAVSGFSQVTKQRLIAEAFYVGTGAFVLSDSFRVVYGSKGRSMFDQNIVDYVTWPYHMANTKFWAFNMYPYNNVDSSSNCPHVFYDSLYYFNHDLGNPSLVAHLNLVDACGYGPSGELSFATAVEYDTAGVPYSNWRKAIHYSGARTDKIYDLVANKSGSYDTLGSTRLTYDVNGRLLADSVYDSINGWSGYCEYFSYDASGHWQTFISLNGGLSGHFDTALRITNAYYPDGRLKVQFTEQYMLANAQSFLSPYSLDSFGYTPGAWAYTFHKHLDFDSIGFFIGDYQVSADHLNAKGLKDTAFMVTYHNMSRDTSFQAITYNNQGNPTSKDGYLVFNGHHSLESRVLFYYEDYLQSKVLQPLSHSASFNLSPNPTTSILTLHHTDTLNTQIRATISNMLGQLIYTETFTPHGSSTQITLGTEIPRGFYVMTVYGADQVLYNGTFQKE